MVAAVAPGWFHIMSRQIFSNSDEYIDIFSCDPPTLEETRKALEQLKDGKAPGTCGVYAEMLKASGESALKGLHRLFCSVRNSGVIPTD